MGEVDKVLCDEVRNKFLALGTDQGKYYEADMDRIKVDDLYVTRFLQHQKMDKDAAAKMIDSVFTWRKESGIRELDYSKDVPHYLTSTYFRNQDGEGSDILWVEPKYFDKSKRDEARHYLNWLIETRRGAAESSRITIVIALEGVSVSDVDIEFIKYFINLFMYYSPYVMKKLVVHNMHWLLNGIWKVVSVMLSEGARKLVLFVSNDGIYKEIPKDSVLACCGGPDPHSFEPK